MYDDERSRLGTRRFEAASAKELWQIDVANVYIRKLPVFYLVAVVDDHSRFCVAAELCRDQRGGTLLGVLHNACTEHGTQKKLLTDQGAGFCSWSGLSAAALSGYVIARQDAGDECGDAAAVLELIEAIAAEEGARP